MTVLTNNNRAIVDIVTQIYYTSTAATLTGAITALVGLLVAVTMEQNRLHWFFLVVECRR